MVGMILDVFPSYKDKDMVDLLYQFERATGLSLNILVEKYLEKVLYEKGYLTVEIEDDSHGEDNGADEEKDERFVEDDDLKYIYKNQNSSDYRIQRKTKGVMYSYGTYTLEEAKEVKRFLIIKNWNKKYSTKLSKLKGVKHKEWIFSEIEKELKE